MYFLIMLAPVANMAAPCSRSKKTPDYNIFCISRVLKSYVYISAVHPLSVSKILCRGLPAVVTKFTIVSVMLMLLTGTTEKQLSSVPEHNLFYNKHKRTAR